MTDALTLSFFLIGPIAGLSLWLLIRSVFRFWISKSELVGWIPFAGRRVAGKTERAYPWPWLSSETLSSWQWMVAWSGISISRIRWSIVGCCVLTIFIGFISISFAILFSMFMILFGCVFLFRQSATRRKRFDEQTPDAVDALVQGLRAGYALPQALAVVERETNDPVAQIFGALARANEYRLSFATALEFVDAQIRSAEWTLVSDALRLQDRSGGNMVPVLATMASGMRDRLRVEREIQTATASGKFSGLIIAALAPLSFALFSVFSPTYTAILIHEPVGRALLLFGVVLELVGFFWIWRITTIDY